MKHYIIDRITAKKLMIESDNSYEDTNSINKVSYVLSNNITLANEPIIEEKSIVKNLNISLPRMFSLTFLVTIIFLLITSNYFILISLILVATCLLSLTIYKLVTITLAHKHIAKKESIKVKPIKNIITNYNQPILHLKQVNQAETISGFDYFWNNNYHNSFESIRKIR